MRSIPHITSRLGWERPALRVQNVANAHKQVCALMHTDGMSAHLSHVPRAGVCQFLSLAGNCVYTHIQHLPWLSDGCFLRAVSAAPVETKEAEREA